MSRFKEWLAYRIAFHVSREVFNDSLQFPKDETYSLTSQIRRSSRSVCASIAEAYRKRIYRQHFISKLTDALAENSETECWLDFALDHRYMSQERHAYIQDLNDQAGKLLSYMIRHPEKFLHDGK